MDKIAIAVALIGSGLSVLPNAASAQRYDFAADFGASVFEYGSGTGGSTFTALPSSGICVSNTNFPCRSTDNGNLSVPDLPAIGANIGSADISAYTFVLPGNTVFLHPGEGIDSDAILAFIAPRNGLYSFNYEFYRLDTTENGNGVSFDLRYNDSPLIDSQATNTLSQFGGGLVGVQGALFLNQGDRLSLAVGNLGDVSYDSTGLTGFISTVPEPATWALMILGFGGIGGAMRRRGKVHASVSFA